MGGTRKEKKRNVDWKRGLAGKTCGTKEPLGRSKAVEGFDNETCAGRSGGGGGRKGRDELG